MYGLSKMWLKIPKIILTVEYSHGLSIEIEGEHDQKKKHSVYGMHPILQQAHHECVPLVTPYMRYVNIYKFIRYIGGKR